MTIRIIDVIPAGDSSETAQDSEPSIAVNPADPTQIIAGSFSTSTSFFLTLDGGTTWSHYDDLSTQDKSLAWKTDGSGFLTETMTLNSDLATYAGTVSSSGFGAAINTYAPANPDDLDQPWIRTGPFNHVYVAYNNLNNYPAGNTASVNVSTDGGATYTTTVIDRIGGAEGQDAPAVRLDVSGSRSYAIFTRWNTLVEDDANGARYGSQVVVVRSDDGGADGFTALGSGGDGTVVANTTSVFANTSDTPLTLGRERIAGGDSAIAIDPNNADHVVVAYLDAPGANGSGLMQLVVAESTDGGVNWTTKYTTDSATRSAQPGLAILDNGTIGLLYDNYDPTTNKLSQHLLKTSDDFASTTDTVLATEKNAAAPFDFHPYLGDFFDLHAVGNTFYGTFSASNDDDGTNASFLNLSLDRDFTGTPGTSNFQLTNGVGGSVSFSIDPFLFIDDGSANPCYCRGTLIMTEQGEVPVERLRIGDRVMTGSREARPIKWIGRRSYSGRFALGQTQILPICITAGALDDGVPRRDLWISPNHAMHLEGVLIEAKDLVNGVSIYQAETVDQIEYFHIELDSHDLIIAEGAWSESFINDDNRGLFHNAYEYRALYPDMEGMPAQYCAPRLDSGIEVERARRKIAGRAGLPDQTEAPPIGTMRGCIDMIYPHRLGGWAQNVEQPDAPVCLDILAGGQSIGQVVANRYRADLEHAGIGTGDHGFEFVLPAGLVVTAEVLTVRRTFDGAALELSGPLKRKLHRGLDAA
jgi:Hint domain